MRTYETLSETCTWRQVYDNLNNVNENLSSTDFLYKTYLSNGQVFDITNRVGSVNNQEARRNNNITITKDYIASFKISGFQFYCRKLNNIVDIDIDCNLYNYRDNKVHFLYLVLSQHGKYEVHNTMFENNEDLVLFARFVIGEDGNSVQFYVIAPFAGSPDYIKGNQFYNVSEGCDIEYFSKENKQFTLSKSKIAYSGINFDDMSSPDVLRIDYTDKNIKFRYVYWSTADMFPRVNFADDRDTNNLITNKIMNYESGTLSDIPSDYFTNQKIYYDIYSNQFVVMYGQTSYETMEEAILSIEEIVNYPKPDNIDYLIPIAVITIKNSSEDYDENNIRIIGLKYDEHELFDSNDIAVQQSLEAIHKAENAIRISNENTSYIDNHTGNKSNPHSVTKNQVGLGNVSNYDIATEAEAQLGTINTKYMTPARTMDTINANSIVTNGNIILKIQTTQPSAQSGKTIIWINPSS